jgi:TRAP-type uncharacterized transport system fused permease subunit
MGIIQSMTTLRRQQSAMQQLKLMPIHNWIVILVPILLLLILLLVNQQLHRRRHMIRASIEIDLLLSLLLVPTERECTQSCGHQRVHEDRFLKME